MSNTFPIVTIANKLDEKFLRRKTKKFDFLKSTKKDRRILIQKMRRTMKAAFGVGLAANQIGLNYRIFVAEFAEKFYAIFNPKIEKLGTEKEILEEGCLSVPGLYGETPRAKEITLIYQNIEGKILKIKARGFLARIFQHEIDHLDGRLYIDRAIRIMNSGHKAKK